MVHFSLIFISVLISFTAYAHVPKKGTIMGSWGPYFYTTDLNSSYGDLEAPLLGGASLAVEGDVDRNGGIEIIISYLHQPYYRTAGGLVLAEKVKRMHISMGYRHWFNPQFSVGGGFYSSYSMGEAQVMHSNLGPTDELRTTAQEPSEDGIDLSFQYEFYAAPGGRTFALVDTRYSYSLSALDGEVRDLYGVVIALKHFIQENSRSESAP